MATANTGLAPVPDEDTEPQHVLVLGDEEFVCRDDLKLGFLLRSAKNGLEGLHDLAVKAVPPEDHDRLFDTTDEMDLEEIGDALARLIESYTDRPTVRASSSRGGSKKTKRK